MTMLALSLLLLTLVAYQLSLMLYRHLNQPIYLHPTIVGCGAIAVILAITKVPYSDYFEANQWIQFLLGPATVALAIPLQQQMANLRLLLVPLLITLPIGALTAFASAILLASGLGAEMDVLLSLSPKSVTTPIAMDLAEELGGLPVLAAGVVAATGVFGALVASPLFKLLNITDHRIQGFTMGVAAHAMGTARAFEISNQCGAFASLGLGLTGLITAICLPYVAPAVLPLVSP
ncbi:MAG: LrgB family protein [Cellvibrionaceae bacterium]